MTGVYLEKGMTVVFEGDSVTDDGRDFGNPNNLGEGYPKLVAAYFAEKYPELGIKFYNRAVSGDRVRDLVRRWQEDCLDLNPDVVSVLVGVNDTWRHFDLYEPDTPERYWAEYRGLLNRVREQNPKAKFIILGSFVLPVLEDRKDWRHDLDGKIEKAKEIAAEFGAPFIPLDTLFKEACEKGKEASSLLHDGVHPTPKGRKLIAEAWISAVEKN